MAHRWPHSTHLLFAFGLAAFLIAGLSIADMFLPRPYDGVVLEADTPGRLIVRKVVPGSGAARAGIRHGHQIVGIDRNVLRSSAHAAELLNRYRIGETVPYLVRSPVGLQEVEVDLGYRQIGSPSYLVACLLGFAFFFTGLFVLRQQPRIRPAQIFFVVCILFLLFLVCRLRPASYSWVDSFVLTTGMLALLYLPACFLHFFLVFPRPVPLRPELDDSDYPRKRRRWLLTLITIYAIPPVVLLISLWRSHRQGSELLLISGAPAPNWWVLAIYMILGLTALAINARKLDNPMQRRGALLVLVGSLFGLLPFLITAVAFPSFLHTEKFIYYGVGPLILIPLTFAYAIVRFQLLDIRVILRKGLLYTATTAVITALYALGIVLFNAFFRGRALADSPYFPLRAPAAQNPGVCRSLLSGREVAPAAGHAGHGTGLRGPARYCRCGPGCRRRAAPGTRSPLRRPLSDPRRFARTGGRSIEPPPLPAHAACPAPASRIPPGPRTDQRSRTTGGSLTDPGQPPRSLESRRCQDGG
jgi:hypothetical protein